MATSPAKGKNVGAVARKLAENLNTDLRTLSTECRRKFPVVKEASESCMLKMRTITARAEDIIPGLVAANQEILQPFILGCDTKLPKIVHMCLIAVQRLIAHEAISMPGANAVIQCLWMLMEAGIEELKLLQTAILLITTNSVVQHESLAKAMVLCFRLHFTKDNTTNNTAAATIRQLVTAVFERVVAEDDVPKPAPLPEMNVDELKAQGRHPPKSLQPCAGDAYLLFQDFCQLVNADQPHWLMGMTEMTRTFGLELVESVLTDFPSVFHKHPEFSFLLKERVCPLVIKLFSPSLKYKQGVPPPPSPTPAERPYFPIVMRLLKMVSVLIKHYYSILATECEIFLSLLVKFLDVEKPMWQRILALEVMNRLCTQPDLLKSFCSCYDMRQHSTNIFQDMVNSLGSFIQSQFLNSPTAQSSQGSRAPDTQGAPPALVGGLPVGGGITPQPAFLYRGIWLPLVVNISAPSGSHRAIFLEMLDKVEAPAIPDGYGISLAFLCLLDVVRGVQNLVEEKKTSTTPSDTETQPAKSDKTECSLNVQLINSSWCGVMAALSLLLESSTDESATEAILKAMQIFANLCGQLGMHTPRDAFITALCKASLPPHYALAVLNTHGPPPVIQRAHSSGRGGTGDSSGGGQEVINSSQVVAVGTPLPTASLPIGAQQASVMLTAKNIQCMRAILSVAHCHGGILGSAWHLVLTTLQHLVWILGLKPSTGGSLKAGQQATDGPNAVVTTAVMADLPVLSAMLSRLFESSQYLDDVALHHLINALCELSTEAMEIAYSNKEPSLFAVAKLLETGLVNLPRLEVLWRPVTGHLQEVCQHPHVGMRSWGAEALTSLIRGALCVKLDPPVHKNVRLQSMILAPLQELSGIMHPDIRQKQLECVLQILHNNGETLAQGWPLVLGVIGAVTNEQGESLIRVAFQSLQLVVTDFLPIMPSTCLQVCVEVAAKFGLQDQELNISLTAIGLLWNVSDYFYQNRDRIIQDLGKDLSPKEREKLGMPPFDALWMCLYMKLGDLCVDLRPAVRKSAGQTLFSTISAHGSLLQPQTWHTALWKVLFPLLERVKELSNKASSTREEVQGGGGNILIHHSRDTAQKQWAETSVLTMAGVARVFNTKRKVLQALDDFPRAWALFLEYIEAAALCGVAEVSLAALKSFQEILQIKKDSKDEWVQLFGNRNPKELIPPVEEKIQRTDQQREQQPTQGTTEVAPPGDQSDTPVEDMALWSNAWKVWLSIGTKVTTPPDMAKPASAYIPSQPFLTALIQIFPALYEHIKSRFVAADLQKLSVVLQRALAVPVHTDSSPFIMPQDNNLTSLQEAILTAVKALHKEILNGAESSPTMYADLFDQLLTFVGYAVKPPRFGKVEAKVVGSAKMVQADWVAMNFVPFAESVVDLVVELYKATAKHPAVIKEYVLQHIIKTFRSPLSLKYGCPSQSTWILVINSLLVILNVGLPVARQNGSSFKGMWNELGAALEDFLFPHHTAPSTLSAEDYQRDEAIDCKVIHLIRDDILPYTKTVPQEFVVKIMSVLNKGSIHSATTTLFIDTDSSRKLREEFAKACFETLLQFSFLSKCPAEEGSITKLAVSSLLQRCKEVLIKYVEDERLSGKCPLPRARMAEMAFVMKAVTTLLTTLKKAPQANVEGNIWQQLVDLYPALVDCTTSSSPQVCRALKEALHQYGDLLTPPRPSSQNGV